jgi:hypothetical protein
MYGGKFCPDSKQPEAKNSYTEGYMRLMVLGAIAFVIGCGDSSGPREVVQVGGLWEFGESMTDQAHDISCTASGTVQISQSGDQFSGTAEQEGTCSGPGGTIDNSGTGNITGGQVNGDDVSFQTPLCQYVGQASGSPSNQMQGTSTCSFDNAGTTFTFSGTWQAGR